MSTLPEDAEESLHAAVLYAVWSGIGDAIGASHTSVAQLIHISTTDSKSRVGLFHHRLHGCKVVCVSVKTYTVLAYWYILHTSRH